MAKTRTQRRLEKREKIERAKFEQKATSSAVAHSNFSEKYIKAAENTISSVGVKQYCPELPEHILSLVKSLTQHLLLDAKNVAEMQGRDKIQTSDINIIGERMIKKLKKTSIDTQLEEHVNKQKMPKVGMNSMHLPASQFINLEPQIVLKMGKKPTEPPAKKRAEDTLEKRFQNVNKEAARFLKARNNIDYD